MGREARKRNEPHLPPVKKIELSSAHSGRRLAAAIILLAVGVAALAYAFSGLFSTAEGWQEIQVSSSAGASCGDDFVLLYELGHGGVSASAEKKALVSLYSDAAVKAYRLFSNDDMGEDTHNIRYINAHPNETVGVDPALYDALEQIAASGDRSLYLGPVYEAYDGLFSCQDQAMTADFDPGQNDALRAYFGHCAAFARDPGAVDVELLGGDRVCLRVSEEYLAFAAEQEIGSFIDLYWMKNAFIADYLADALRAGGYTAGALSSVDGFVRNLYGGEEAFSFNVFDRAAQAGVMTYDGPMSIVYLHAYPLGSQDAGRYYEMADGRICTAFLDTADGLSKAARDDLLVCSRDLGCARTLLELVPIYVADVFDGEALAALAEKGICSVLCENGEIRYNDPELTVTAGEGYSAVYSG